MDRSIRQWCTECMSCQQSKVHKHVHSPILKFELPSERFQTVHIDIVGPLPAVKNLNDDYKLLLTTRWIEACPLSEITASRYCG